MSVLVYTDCILLVLFVSLGCLVENTAAISLQTIRIQEMF